MLRMWQMSGNKCLRWWEVQMPRSNGETCSKAKLINQRKKQIKNDGGVPSALTLLTITSPTF
jgi:hypothetical protein